MANIFDDLGAGFGSGSALTGGLSGAASGAAIGGAGGGPAGAVVGAFIGVAAATAQERQKRKAAQAQESAIQLSQEEARQNKNALVEENFRRRSRSRGGGQGLAPGQEGASRQGTSLLAPQQSAPSLFGDM